VAGLPFSGKGDEETTSPEVTDPNVASGVSENPAATAKSKREEKREAKKQAKQAKQQAKYGVFDPNEINKGKGLGGFLSTGGGKLTVFSVILALIAGAGVYLYTTDRSASVQQVVVNRTIPPKTVVTRDDVKVVEAPLSAVVDPTLLMTLDEIDTNTWMTFGPLAPGVVLYDGSLVPFSRAGTSLPADMQLVSIEVEPANAAGGSVAAGDIVDIYITGDGTAASTIMRGVEVVDVLIAAKSISAASQDDPAAIDAPGANSPELKGGIGSIYKLLVDPEQAGIIADSVGLGRTFYLALTDGQERNSDGEIISIPNPEATSGDMGTQPAPLPAETVAPLPAPEIVEEPTTAGTEVPVDENGVPVLTPSQTDTPGRTEGALDSAGVEPITPAN
jgi:Flp pilus assembly protein CpaB